MRLLALHGVAQNQPSSIYCRRGADHKHAHIPAAAAVDPKSFPSQDSAAPEWGLHCFARQWLRSCPELSMATERNESNGCRDPVPAFHECANESGGKLYFAGCHSIRPGCHNGATASNSSADHHSATKPDLFPWRDGEL